MTPGARLSAAIELLDAVIAGEPAERELTRWARASRFAGSKDRAAVRDLVYDGLRRRRSLGWLGGGDSGRAIVLAHEAQEGAELDALFTGEGFDPAPVTGAERAALARDLGDAPEAVRLDYPDFLHDELAASLGEDFAPVMAAMRDRAPVDLRVNTLKTNADAATVVLARDGVSVARHPLARNALRVLENPRLVAASRAYTQGHGRAAGRVEPGGGRDRRRAAGHDRARLLRGRRRQDAGARRRARRARPADGLGRQPAADGRPAGARAAGRRRGADPERRRVRGR